MTSRILPGGVTVPRARLDASPVHGLVERHRRRPLLEMQVSESRLGRLPLAQRSDSYLNEIATALMNCLAKSADCS